MGIFSFFPWLKRVYPSSVSIIDNGSCVKVKVDDFMIDGNCIYHPAAQKVFKYGEYKKESILHPNSEKLPRSVDYELLSLEVFKEVCRRMDELVHIVNPKRRFIMCTDGSAPMAKQFQQRCRRYKSSIDNGGGSVGIGFDPNSLTPGTKFMYDMSKYIKNHLMEQKKTNKIYSNIEIIFNDERVPGEGEHKLINFIRRHPNRMKGNSFCIYSADADLIMLGLATQEERFYIIRENIYNKHLKQNFLVDLQELRKDLISVLIPIHERDNCGKLHEYKTINDFVLLCFFVGNDFLPHMPSIEIKDGGIDQILRIYSKLNVKLTYYDSIGMVKIHIENFIKFCDHLATLEPKLINDRSRSDIYAKSTPLKCLNKNIVVGSGGLVNFDGFKKDYYLEKIHISNRKQVEDLCHKYIHGLQWVLTYYTYGVPDWEWKFDERYGPFIIDLAEHLKTYTQKKYPQNNPIPPFLQLLCVLPPSSKELLPECMRCIYENRSDLFQKEVKIDLEGKRRDYEGIVMVEDPNVEELKKEYNLYIEDVDRKTMRRNKKGNIHLIR